MVSPPRSPSSAHASLHRGADATTAATAGRGSDAASACESEWRNETSASGSTVVGNPEDMLMGWSDIAPIYAGAGAGGPPKVTNMSPLLALTLGQAKAAALAVVVLLIVGAFASAWLMKTVVQKVVVVVILLLVALLVWSQRAALQECADKVQTAGFRGETSCTFLGNDINISTPNSN